MSLAELLRSGRPVRVVEALNFKHVAVGVGEERVVDAVLGAVFWPDIDRPSRGEDASAPTIDIIGHERENDTLGAPRVLAFTHSHERAVGDTEDQAGSLVDDYLQTQDLRIEPTTGRKIRARQKRDLSINVHKR